MNKPLLLPPYPLQGEGRGEVTSGNCYFIDSNSTVATGIKPLQNLLLKNRPLHSSE
jgi:hypothetical protein